MTPDPLTLQETIPLITPCIYTSLLSAVVLWSVLFLPCLILTTACPRFACLVLAFFVCPYSLIPVAELCLELLPRTQFTACESTSLCAEVEEHTNTQS